MNKGIKSALGLAIVVGVVAIAFAGRQLRSDKVVAAEVVMARVRPVTPTILASGTLLYEQQVDLTAEVVAKVSEILIVDGQEVTKGQVLMRLDPEVYRNSIARETAARAQTSVEVRQAHANVELRREQLERSRLLARQQLIERNRLQEDELTLRAAQAELDALIQRLAQAEASVRDAQDQLGKTEIRAPLSGRVVATSIKVGETAIPSTSALAGAKLLTIADTSRLIADLKVDEADIAKVDLSQPAAVFPVAYSDRAVMGSVERIALAPTVDGQSKSYLVRVALPDIQDMRLRSGMSARAEIRVSSEGKHVALPVESVITDSDGKSSRSHIWVVQAGRALKREVTLGISDDRWQTVASGVQVGEQVVAGPARILRVLSEGVRVDSSLTERAE